jgi:hypothetical protein
MTNLSYFQLTRRKRISKARGKVVSCPLPRDLLVRAESLRRVELFPALLTHEGLRHLVDPYVGLSKGSNIYYKT